MEVTVSEYRVLGEVEGSTVTVRWAPVDRVWTVSWADGDRSLPNEKAALAFAESVVVLLDEKCEHELKADAVRERIRRLAGRDAAAVRVRA